MANITFLRWKAHVKLARFQSLASLTKVSCRNFSNAGEENELEETAIDFEQSWAEEEEKAQLEQLRNVSGLPPKYYKQLHGDIVEPAYKDIQRRRKMFTTYGSRSGEDPKLLWPSKQEITQMQMEDREDEVPLLEKIQQLNLEKDEALKAKSERQKMVEKNMAQMNKWISEYYRKVEAAELEVQKRKEKKDALLDEARDYFGYGIKANDPKFQQMVEEKEERERREAKDLKKKEKARKMAERLKQDVQAMKVGSGTDPKQEEKSS